MSTLASIHYYPIKACRGQSAPAAFVERRGIEHDRRFLIVDQDDVFITQRDVPALALVVAHWSDTTLELTAPNMPRLTLPVTAHAPIRQVTVWSSVGVKAIDQGDEAADWFSTYLQRPARLVYMPTDSLRPVNPQYAARPDDHVSFADGYPVLIASQESLDDLNARLETPLPMNRFRPNLVITGCQPFAEDTWKRIRIGEVELALVKPCARCEVTTIDQTTAAQGKEPLKTLATFRRLQGSKVMFGMNAIPLNEGQLRVDEPVEILA